MAMANLCIRSRIFAKILVLKDLASTVIQTRNLLTCPALVSGD